MRLIGIAGLALSLLLTVGCGQTTNAPAESDARTTLPTTATWSLDADASRLAFVSIKSGEIIEAHYFSGLSGRVSPGGEATVDIPLDQVETRIGIRNERMREMLFETAEHPVSTIRASINPDDFENLAIGDRAITEVEAVLSLHGLEASIAADAVVTRIGNARIEVASAEPVVVHLADFNLEAGLEKLREVAGLPAITASSPVVFNFVFHADEA